MATANSNPIQYTLSLAQQVNSQPLPSVPEVFGVRLPPPSDCLTQVDFDLVPNKPPPGVKLYDEEIEEVDESDEEDGDEEDEDGDMEPAAIPDSIYQQQQQQQGQQGQGQRQVPVPPPMGSLLSPADVDMMTPGGGAPDEGSEGEGGGGGGLFSGGEEEEESGDEAMDVSMTAPDAPDAANGAKRKLVEEDDYD